MSRALVAALLGLLCAAPAAVAADPAVHAHRGGSFAAGKAKYAEETLPADMKYEREQMPLLKCPLAAGDWLYIPAGYWHMGHSEEASLTLSIGVMSPTAPSA